MTKFTKCEAKCGMALKIQKWYLLYSRSKLEKEMQKELFRIILSD